MNFISGVIKDAYPDYVLYFVENLSEEMKQEIRNRLVAICYGAAQAQLPLKIYSYKETVKEFVKRYRTNKDASEDRKKGMIGELLVHVILELEGRFMKASPFFNMEERSFRKGYDVTLFEIATDELWIDEVKSGALQKGQKDASSAVVGLLNKAKYDLKTRLNDSNISLWSNALNAARVAMIDSNHQKDAVMKLLGQCADDAVDGINSSNSFNVVLSATLFHSMSERMEVVNVEKKHKDVVREGVFKKVFMVHCKMKLHTLKTE